MLFLHLDCTPKALLLPFSLSSMTLNSFVMYKIGRHARHSQTCRLNLFDSEHLAHDPNVRDCVSIY